MFSEIVSVGNVRRAYLKIVEQFAIDRKSFKYHGLDNLLLRDYDLNSNELINLVQEELIQKKEITPALSVFIPKKSNPEKFREIFIYNIRERVKAQAIFQVLSPEFEKVFSDRLFSYRPGKPPYLAAKNFSRRYRRAFLNDQALILDLTNYSDLIDKKILLSKLQLIFSDKNVIDLLSLFIFNKTYRQGVIETPNKGLIQGVPLIALFANLYLTDLDFKYQSQTSFYIRVGDDIAILDKNIDRLEKIKDDLINNLVDRKLELNEKKIYIGPAQGEFSFLGYRFKNGLISLEDAYVKKIELGWKKILTYKNLSDNKKDQLLGKIMAESKNNYNFQFQKLVKDKSQINDDEQIKKLSENFFKILTKFFYGHYSQRYRRLLEDRIKHRNIQSLYSFYKKFHYERN